MTYAPSTGALWVRVLIVGAGFFLFAFAIWSAHAPTDLFATGMVYVFLALGVLAVGYGVYVWRTAPERHDWPGGPGAKTR